MTGLGSRMRESVTALRGVFANPGLRRVELAYAGSSIGTYAYGITLAVYAYGQGGATAVGFVMAVRLGISSVVAPFAASLADRFERRRVLLASDVARLVLVGVVALVVSRGGSPLVVYGLAILLSVTGTVFRPTEASLLPILARTPAELTAANVASSTFDSVASFLGPAISGGLLALSGTSSAFAFTAAMFVWSVLNVVRIPETGGRDDGAEEESTEGGFRALAAGFVAIRREPRLRLLIGLYGAQCFVSGTLGVLLVATALNLVHIGTAGVGLLEAVCGIGSIAGAGLMLALVGRQKLAADFAIGLVFWGSPLVVVGVVPAAVVAYLAWAVIGVANTVVDIAGITLLQRATPENVAGRVFGVLEAATIAGFALGAVAAPGLIAIVHVRGALMVSGALLPVCAVVAWRRLVAIDEGAHIPVEQLAALQTVPFLAVLPLQTQEYLAARLTRVELVAGSYLISEGDEGDRFYILESGTIAIELPEGDKLEEAPAFAGEIALLRNVPRTASVRVVDDARFFALERHDFLGAVTGQARARAGAEDVVGSRLRAATAG